LKKIGLLIELNEGVLKPANLGMITSAVKEGHEIFAILMEAVTSDIQQQLTRYGVDHIVKVVMNRPDWNPARWAQTVVTVLETLDIHILMGMTSAQGKDLLPRIAAILDAPLVMDCVHVDVDRQMAKTSQYSGKTMATFSLIGETILYGMRPNAIAAVVHPTAPLVTEQILDIPEETKLKVLEVLPGKPGTQNLSEADVIVSGGRGMKNGENFKLIFDCAKAFGDAAVGASRVAVDEGWVPYAMQVGQTGTKVNPKVYIACGISGSVQHLAGMKTSGLIIAINTDANAAILAHCDYFVIGDLFDILPALALELGKDKGTD
jgi:electron transfer flavoprotein alpha subunit